MNETRLVKIHSSISFGYGIISTKQINSTDRHIYGWTGDWIFSIGESLNNLTLVRSISFEMDIYGKIIPGYYYVSSDYLEEINESDLPRNPLYQYKKLKMQMVLEK